MAFYWVVVMDFSGSVSNLVGNPWWNCILDFNPSLIVWTTWVIEVETVLKFPLDFASPFFDLPNSVLDEADHRLASNFQAIAWERFTCAEDGLEVLNFASTSAVKQQHHLQIFSVKHIGKQSSQEPAMTVPSPRTPKGSQRSFPWRRLVAEKQLIL